MSVGKSSIKRVAAKAPAAETKTEGAEAKAPVSAEAPVKKPAARKTASASKKPAVAKKTAKKAEPKAAPAAKSETKAPDAKFPVGTALPYYLL